MNVRFVVHAKDNSNLTKLVRHNLVGDVLRATGIKPRSAVLIFPPGLHHDMQYPEVLVDHFVHPLVTAAASLPGVVITICGVHSMAPNLPEQFAEKQSAANITNLNRALARYAAAHGLDYIDMYSVPVGSMSFDGVHYAVDGNGAKAQVILAHLDTRTRPAVS